MLGLLPIMVHFTSLNLAFATSVQEINSINQELVTHWRYIFFEVDKYDLTKVMISLNLY